MTEPRTWCADRARWGGLVIALSALGCRGEQSALDPRGPQAAHIFELTKVLVVGATVVFVLVMAFLVAALMLGKRRPPGDEPLDEEDQGGVTVPKEHRKIRAVSAAVGITAATLVALLVYDVTIARAIAWAPGGDALTVNVVGHQWWWEVTYRDASTESGIARTANEIHIPVGRRVVIELESRDVIHSFWVPNLHGKMDAVPGRKNVLVLQADEPGVYRGQCAEFCGLAHAKMAFYVVAEPPEDFERWLERQARPAEPPTDPLALRGQEIFLTRPCATCHSVRGTTAMASAGPDLTHVGSRRSLGSGALPNTRGNVAGWILDPQHAKPGTLMPATPLDADSVEALLAYLFSLD